MRRRKSAKSKKRSRVKYRARLLHPVIQAAAELRAQVIPKRYGLRNLGRRGAYFCVSAMCWTLRIGRSMNGYVKRRNVSTDAVAGNGRQRVHCSAHCDLLRGI